VINKTNFGGVKMEDNGIERFLIRRSMLEVAKTYFWMFVGRFITNAVFWHKKYKLTISDRYKNTYSRVSAPQLDYFNNYVTTEGALYRENQESLTNIEETSQYYLYKKIGSNHENLKICNVGCFYCGADVHFLRNNENCKIYGLDFGDIKQLNEKILHKRLFLYPGYPLQALEDLLDKEGTNFFDYVLFVRTATLINKNELFSYMDVVSRISKAVAFLEVASIGTTRNTRIDIDRIDLENPMKTYGGMYVHNYKKLLQKYGYALQYAELLEPGFFRYDSAGNNHIMCIIGSKV
jgi:hypothetical protein